MIATIKKTSKGQSLDAKPLTRSKKPEDSETIVMTNQDFATQVKGLPIIANLPRKLWIDYKADPSIFKRNIIVEFYLPWIRKHASIVAMRTNRKVNDADLSSIGIIGMFDAMKKYQPAKGILFTTYAALRIRGQMLDQIRNSDWAPRLVCVKERVLKDAIEEAAQDLGRQPFQLEVANKLGINPEEYDRIRMAARRLKTRSICDTPYFKAKLGDGELGSNVLADSIINTKSIDPSISSFEGETLNYALRFLDIREKRVIYLYYKENLNLREVGHSLGVSESRACQLHARSIQKLHKALKEFADDLICTK